MIPVRADQAKNTRNATAANNRSRDCSLAFPEARCLRTGLGRYTMKGILYTDQIRTGKPAVDSGLPVICFDWEKNNPMRRKEQQMKKSYRKIRLYFFFCSILSLVNILENFCQTHVFLEERA